MSLIEVQALQKKFKIKNTEQIVFENLHFHIQKGEFIALLGPSGCGKSTLLRLLGGLDDPSQGKIINHSLRKSFVFQEPRLLNWRNCLENALLPVEIEKGEVEASDREKANSLLESLGLTEARTKYPHQLSGGMKMRTAVARSLIVNPDFLLLDEPFAALDETTRHHLQEELRLLYEKHNWTVVFVTHSIEEACFLSNRVFIFSKNRRGLFEHQSSLLERRDRNLRNQINFFEEIRKVREIFEREALG